MSLDNLPVEWSVQKFEKVVFKIVGGGTPSKNNPEYYLGNIPWMSVKDMNKNILEDTVDHITQEAIDNSATNLIPKGTPIIATRMSLGKVVVANFDSAINQDLKAIFLDDNIDKNFFVYWYRSQSKLIESLGTGTTVKGIRLEVINNLDFPVVPLAEQQEIVRQLDVMLAQVEQIKARLDAIPAILKKFRQSVLADAVSGKLTEDLGSAQEWIEKPLSEVASHVVDCLHSTPKWSENGKICVRTTAFNPFFLDLTEQGFVSQEVYDERIQRLKPEPKDILYSREGTVGIACQIPLGMELCLGQRMVLIRAGKEIDDKFLTIILNSHKILEIVKSKTMGSTAPRVNMSDIRAYPIPLPSLDEQRIIVGKVEVLFKSADHLDDLIKLAQKRVSLLTQSILAKAFSGELTAEWREQHQELITGVNSAESLLAKIQAEREASKPVKKTRAKKEA